MRNFGKPLQVVVHLRQARFRISFYARDRDANLSPVVAPYGLVHQDTRRDKCFEVALVARGRFSMALLQTNCKDHS